MDENLIQQDEAQENSIETIDCAHCSNRIQECDANNTTDGLVCEQCNQDYVTCNNCGDVYHEDDVQSLDGNYYCSDCYDDIPRCERCDHREVDMDTTTVSASGGDEEWCDCCRDDHSFWCERCEENFSNRCHSSTRVRGVGVICEDCCERVGTFECDECHNTWSDDDRAYDEDNEDDYICNYCANNGKRNIHSYSYKPAPLFKTATNQKLKTDMLFFGLELEVERDNSSMQVGKMAEEILNEKVYYMKNDGSLNNGFEIVTHPMTFEFIQEHKGDVFKPMLDKLISAGYRSYDSKTCGIHIHLSKKCFTTWQLYRFIKFFLDNRDFVTAISQRNIEQLERWATIEEESNDSIVYKAKKKGGNSRRYSAVNLQNDRTIEIRIFRGTLNYLSFLKNIEFCYALFNFSRDIKETTVTAFKEYIEQSNEYAMLKKFIKTKNL